MRAGVGRTTESEGEYFVVEDVEDCRSTAEELFSSEFEESLTCTCRPCQIPQVQSAFVDRSECVICFSGGSLSECGEGVVFFLGVECDIFTEGQEDGKSSL